MTDLLYNGMSKLDSKNRFKLPTEIADQFDNFVYFAYDKIGYFMCPKEEFEKLKNKEDITFFGKLETDKTKRIILTGLLDKLNISKTISLEGRVDRIYIQSDQKNATHNDFFNKANTTYDNLIVNYTN